ncbi:MAG: DNA-directed RNA polymerase subunit K [Crenarchaeota archaeon]|nr:DNA-directed RNA polymerase subunit K [Thermoproteota archaeon]
MTITIYRRSGRVKIGPPRLTRFERARVIGARALQISMGAPPLIDVETLPPDVREDPVRIAKYELEAGILPMTIVRYKRGGEIQLIPIQWLVKPSSEEGREQTP